MAGADGGRAAPNGHNGTAREEDLLEQVVDVHAFTPAALSAHARGPGSRDGLGIGEELAASLFGWVNRALEATAAPDEIPYAWRMYAYRGYLLLQALDRSLLEPRLPAAMFYNLLISGRAPPHRVEGPPAPARRDSLTTQPSTASRKGIGWCGTSRSEPPASVRAGRGQAALRAQRVEHLGRLLHGRPRAAACRASAFPRPVQALQSRPPARIQAATSTSRVARSAPPERGVEAEPAAQAEEQRAAAEHRAEGEPGGKAPSCPAWRGGPGHRQEDRYCDQHPPTRCWPAGTTNASARRQPDTAQRVEAPSVRRRPPGS